MVERGKLGAGRSQLSGGEEGLSNFDLKPYFGANLPGHVRVQGRIIRAPGEGDLQALPEHERERLLTFRHTGRRAEFFAGRLLLREMLSDLLGLPPIDVPLELLEDGRPWINGDRLYVSLGHSSDLAVAAAAPVPIGLDVEHDRTVGATLLERIRHPQDPPTDGSSEAILRVWTIKEAVLKCTGSGFREAARNLCILSLEQDSVAVAGHQGSSFQVFTGRYSGYHLALALPC